ncbi:hypothetical protein RUE5091_04567 [Ruegeria denitrificans]|uniref:Uncharacterized protein n=1 Tax=Ruegeria denitrificans TaxID=1715692 RepID=A0A0N7MB22_9RHOB|nr:hypothetical protein [Ruegeria denitrificans]CUK20853.1 hypothetical protein RUE5091_04567 [Ruegeria denitrificans]
MWNSIDEGDVVEQTHISGGQTPKFRPPFKTGETLEFNRTTSTATEVEQVEGNRLLSGKFWSEGSMWFQGRWFDPFDEKIQQI